MLVIDVNRSIFHERVSKKIFTFLFPVTMTFVLKFVLQFLVSRVMFPPNLKFPHLSDSEKIEGTRD